MSDKWTKPSSQEAEEMEDAMREQAKHQEELAAFKRKSERVMLEAQVTVTSLFGHTPVEYRKYAHGNQWPQHPKRNFRFSYPTHHERKHRHKADGHRQPIPDQ